MNNQIFQGKSGPEIQIEFLETLFGCTCTNKYPTVIQTEPTFYKFEISLQRGDYAFTLLLNKDDLSVNAFLRRLVNEANDKGIQQGQALTANKIKEILNITQ